jgi:hypothetical protein
VEGMVCIPDGPGGSYSENSKAKGEDSVADDFEIFRERQDDVPEAVKNRWNEKVLKVTSELILSSLKWQIPGSEEVGNSLLVSFHSVANCRLKL